ncbi:MAG: glycosyltransferase family 39 protein [Acidobacteriota bacterium]|nr:glycosyltransferase family 39 protein [Acidobacteriota bacterium]
MQLPTLAKRVWLLLFIAVIASYCYGLNHIPLVGPDEPRYAQVAREMYQRADLITPTLGGHTWFEKPALLYWIMMAAFSLFGSSETAARIGPAVFGLLTVLAVFWVGRSVARSSAEGELCGTGAWSGLVTASMLGIIVFSRAASFDIIVTMTITWALSFFLVHELEVEEGRRRHLLVGFYVFVGLSLLAKGLIGIVIPFGVIAIYQLMRRVYLSPWFLRSLIWGIPLTCAVAAIWYGPVIARHGWPFIDEFFVQHHFARYFSNKYRHPGPVYFYLLCLIPLTLPWTVLIADALSQVRFWKWRGTNPFDKLRVFALAWLLLPLALFSFSGSKLAGYILPVLPATGLLAGLRLALFTSQAPGRDWAMRATGGLLTLIATFGAVMSVRGGYLSTAGAALVVAPMMIAGLINLLLSEKRMIAAVSVVCAALLFPMLVLNSGMVKLTASESVRDLVRAANERGYGAAPIYGLGEIDRTAEFYAAGRLAYGDDGEPIVFENAGQVMLEAYKRGPILILVPREYDQLLRLKTLGAEPIGDNGRFVLIAVAP